MGISKVIYTIKTKLSSLLFFTCLGPGKVSWAVSDVRSMAVSIRMGLPLSVAQIIGADTWKGGALVQLEDTLTRPVAQDIIVNYSWVKPFVQRFRSSVPSVFFVTDVFLFLTSSTSPNYSFP